MTRPFLLSVGFALATVATLAAADRLVDGAVDTPVERQYADLWGSAERLDRVVIGTSHAAFGIDPADLAAPGFAVYNFANYGGGPLYLEAWYPLYRARHGPPRLVIWAMDWFALRLNRRLADDAEHLDGPAWRAALAAGGLSGAPALLYNTFPLLKDQAAFMRHLLGERGEFTILLDRYFRGAAPLAVAPYSRRRTGQDDAFRGAELPHARAARDAVVRMLRADGARVVLVQVPEYLPAVGDVRAETADLVALARANGWPFLNYNVERRSALNQDPALFADWGHLNVAGRAAFGRVLRRDLEALGVVPVGRGT